ncbi:MAG: GntR family transcriptional regulator [Bacteroidaceae bacterium]|nr:GntR family transcriptional regulator [Bacteroidaceae bacterium]
MLQLGKRNDMVVARKVDFGVYLDGGDIGDVLLPKRYIPEGCEVGDTVNVFLYLDNEERLVATTKKSMVEVNHFAFLEVKWINEHGAFLDWGLMKDLFCPFREQKMKMQVGKKYVVYAYIDAVTYRIVASAKVEKFLSDEEPPYSNGDEVEILVQQKTDLGFKAIIDDKFGGMIFDNDVFKEIRTGDRMKAYIKQIRPDGKIDLSLQPSGRENVVGFAGRLLRTLIESENGFLPYHDKTSPDEIYAAFGVSKKTFKKAVGDLYKHFYITIESNGIALTDKGRIEGTED